MIKKIIYPYQEKQDARVVDYVSKFVFLKTNLKRSKWEVHIIIKQTADEIKKQLALSNGLAYVSKKVRSLGNP